MQSVLNMCFLLPRPLQYLSGSGLRLANPERYDLPALPAPIPNSEFRTGDRPARDFVIRIRHCFVIRASSFVIPEPDP
jgi:hypothetical protein